MNENYRQYMLAQLKELLSTTSMIGYYERITEYLLGELRDLGYSPRTLNNGGIVVEAGGLGNPIVIAAHADEIGLVVRYIRDDGKLACFGQPGVFGPYVNCTNVRIITRNDKVYTGILHKIEASLHVADSDNILVSPELHKNMVVSIDEKVACKADVLALGIRTGDIVSVEPNTVFTDSGFIKSRYLDNNAAVAILLTYLKFLKDENMTPGRKVYAFFTMYEERGLGARCGIPDDAVELMSIDVGCVSAVTESKEDKVFIGVWDSRMPYNREIVTKLAETAEKHGIDYALDVFWPGYGSDGIAALEAGYDVKCSLIGPGVLGTHTYERTHIDALVNTYKLLKAYLT